MSHTIRQVTAKRVAPVIAAASTIATKPRQVVPLRHDRATETESPVQTTSKHREDHRAATPVPRTAKFQKEVGFERTPKSRVHQEILRKKRQRDVGTQTEPTEEVRSNIEHVKTRRRYVKYLFKAAAEKIRANKLQERYDESESVRQSLSSHVIAMKKAAEEHGSWLETAYQEQASTLKIKCEAMFASFEEVRAAHQFKVQEHDSLQAANERLKKHHDRVVNEVSRLAPWMKLLEEDAGQWQRLRQMHSTLASEASAAESDPMLDNDIPDYQELEAMLWSNLPHFDQAQTSEERTCLSTTNSPQTSTSAISLHTTFASTDPEEYNTIDAEFEDEGSAAIDTILQLAAVVVKESTKIETSKLKPSPFSWSRRLVPENYYEIHLANDAKEYPHAATWDVDASISLEVGSDKDGYPQYFRFVPQVATLPAEHIVPRLLHVCQQKLTQYVRNNLAILAGLQVPEPGRPSLQLTRHYSPSKPIWLRRGQQALPKVKPGASYGQLDKLHGSSQDLEAHENPLDDCHALPSGVESTRATGSA